MERYADTTRCHVTEDNACLVGLKPLHVVLTLIGVLTTNYYRCSRESNLKRSDAVSEVHKHSHAEPFVHRVVHHADDVGHFCSLGKLTGAEDVSEHVRPETRSTVFQETVYDFGGDAMLFVETSDVGRALNASGSVMIWFSVKAPGRSSVVSLTQLVE